MKQVNLSVFNTFGRICVLHETKDVNSRVFNMITGINESKTLTKDISYKCKCKFDSTKCHSSQKWNNDKCRCECKNPKEHHVCKDLESCYMYF